jgi:hypothetical protein
MASDKEFALRIVAQQALAVLSQALGTLPSMQGAHVHHGVESTRLSSLARGCGPGMRPCHVVHICARLQVRNFLRIGEGDRFHLTSIPHPTRARDDRTQGFNTKVQAPLHGG